MPDWARVARLVALAFVVLAWQASPAAGACPQRGDRVFTLSSAAAVAVPTDSRGDYSSHDIYGCLRPGGAPVYLSDNSLDDAIFGPLRTAGRYVTYVAKRTDGTGAYESLEFRVLDLSKGYEQRRLIAESEYRGLQVFSDAVVTARGAVAFIARSGPSQSPFVVYRCDSSCSSPERDLDVVSRGGHVGRKSLVYETGGVMRWREDGRRRSSRLR